jgi:hypothetical protein
MFWTAKGRRCDVYVVLPLVNVGDETSVMQTIDNHFGNFDGGRATVRPG